MMLTLKARDVSILFVIATHKSLSPIHLVDRISTRFCKRIAHYLLVDDIDKTKACRIANEFRKLIDMNARAYRMLKF